MNARSPMPADRHSFNGALASVLADHATLRHLADCAARPTGYSTDGILSLADAVATHERTEASLFALPFLARAPGEVLSTAARVGRRREEFVSGKCPDPDAAASNFVEALLSHLAAEEAWLAHEKELKHERLMTAI